MENYTSKYFGVLKHIKEDFVNKDVFEEILKFNLFDEFPLSKNHSGESYFGLEIEPEDFKVDFNDFFLYNKKEYNLKSTVWNDMFNFHANRIELYHALSDFEINEYLVKFHSLITKEEKIDFLKKLNTDFLKCYDDKDLLFLYIKDEPARGYKTWEEYYVLNHIEEFLYDRLFLFLKGDYDFYDESLNTMWREFRIYKDIFEFINDRLSTLEENQKSVIVEKVRVFEDWRSDIFKDRDSRLLFNFIVDEFTGEKNTSLFSVLYKFFQQKNRIIITDKSSNIYKDFICKNYDLKSFSRIQEQTSFKENTVWDKAFRIFEELEKNFTQKFE